MSQIISEEAPHEKSNDRRRQCDVHGKTQMLESTDGCTSTNRGTAKDCGQDIRTKVGGKRLQREGALKYEVFSTLGGWRSPEVY